jgi:hypothetical protein
LRERGRYLYSLLVHHRAQRTDLAGDKLSSVTVREAKEGLEVLLTLDGIEKTGKASAFYDDGQNILYLEREVEGFEIALELSRAFGLDFSHVSDVEVVLREPLEKIQERFSRQGIAIVDWEPEPLPEVARQPEKEPPEKTTPTGRQIQHAAPGMPPKPPTTGTGGTPPSQPGQGHRPTGSRIANVRRVKIPYNERMALESSNIARIISFEESESRVARDVSRESRGYDLQSNDTSTGTVRYIELKVPGYVMLTEHENQVAGEKGDSYFLYVIDGEFLYIIQDPVKFCSITKLEVLESRWEVTGWEQGEKYQL